MAKLIGRDISKLGKRKIAKVPIKPAIKTKPRKAFKKHAREEDL
jgi:hypothetical protein